MTVALLWYVSILGEHVDHSSVPALSGQNGLYPSPDMHGFLIWHFDLNPKYQYNVIRGARPGSTPDCVAACTT